jgi:hypothetical protein
MSLDTLTIVSDSQKYLCLSFLTNKEQPNITATVSGIRFGGAFSTYEEACAQAKNIQQLDPYHNVFVGEAGKWLPFDPNPNSAAVRDSEYADEKLNELMKGHKETQEKAKIFHEIRKNEKMAENLTDNLKAKQESKDEIVKMLSKAQTEEEMKTLSNSLESIEEQIKKMELKKKEYIDAESNLKKQVEL